MRVYLLGAGFNIAIGPAAGRKPPFLAKDFFRVLFADEHFHVRGRRDAQAKQAGQALMAYIESYWKLTYDDLLSADFDLEECYTLLELQRTDMQGKNPSAAQQLEVIQDELTALMGSYLADVKNRQIPPLAATFAEHVLEINAVIMTFNYDLVVEDAIRQAAGSQGFAPPAYFASLHAPPTRGDALPDDVISYSLSNWKPALGYGFQFGDVSLDQSGNIRYVSGGRYYGIQGHRLYDRPLLKLHGSVNWANVQYADGSKAVLLDDSIWYRGPGGSIVSPFKTVVKHKPVLITPVLYKRYDQPPFDEIWPLARSVLSSCSELVVIGYSFPPTDFAIRRLLLEAFQNHQLSMLAVVNPDKKERERVGEIVKMRTHYDGTPAFYESLKHLLDQHGLQT